MSSRRCAVTSPRARLGRDVDSFRVSYVSDDPEKARKVTERLASLYIDQNSKDREAQADNTSEFLDTQLAEAKRRLIEQEKKLEDYRKSHAGQMPSQLQGNLQAIQNANLQLQSLNESTNRAQERRLLIERQLADALAVPRRRQRLRRRSDAAAPLSTAQQLELARSTSRIVPAALYAGSSGSREPRANDCRTGETAGERSPDDVHKPHAKPVTPAEAAQQKRIRDFQAELAVLDYQLAANRTEDARLKQIIAEYQAKVDAVPTRESELVELTRDYSTMQAAYANLLMKREDSVIAANLERRQIGEQFRLVDAASRPERPYNQAQRLAIMASGAAAGLVLGLLVVGAARVSRLELQARGRSGEGAVAACVRVDSGDGFRRRTAGRRNGAAGLIDAGGTALLLAAVAVVAVVAYAVVRTARPMYERFYGLSELPVRAHGRSQIPVPHEKTARGAEQSAVRAAVGAIAHAADWRGRDRQDDAHPGGPRVGAVPPRPVHLSEQSRPPHGRLHAAARAQVRSGPRVGRVQVAAARAPGAAPARTARRRRNHRARDRRGAKPQRRAARRNTSPREHRDAFRQAAAAGPRRTAASWRRGSKNRTFGS